MRKAPSVPFYASLQSFQQYKQQHLTEVFVYEDENHIKTYFYFYKGKKSAYFTIGEFRKVMDEHDEKIEELKQEFKKLKIK